MPDTDPRGLLLAVVELGGYPNFTPIYQRAGFDVVMEHTMRKAVGVIKKKKPRVIVAEFNYQSDFRDRTSSLETMMATVQRNPGTRVIVFYEKEFEHQFARIRDRFPFHGVFTFPVDEEALEASLQAIED